MEIFLPQLPNYKDNLYTHEIEWVEDKTTAKRRRCRIADSGGGLMKRNDIYLYRASKKKSAFLRATQYFYEYNNIFVSKIILLFNITLALKSYFSNPK